MGKSNRKRHPRQKQQAEPKPVHAKPVGWLFGIMAEGKEYASLVSQNLAGVDLIAEQRLAISKIKEIRGNYIMCYCGNIVKPSHKSSVCDLDDLPFKEMVSSVPNDVKNVDVVMVTNGGSAEQVSKFVDTLRDRFDAVNFLLPHNCLSAGTLFALSGDSIWMDSRAVIGPIDPQIPDKDGRFIPAQSLLALIKEIQTVGDAALKDKTNIPWTLIRLLDRIDARHVGEALSLTQYAERMATDFLVRYKFKNWESHATSGLPVRPEEKVTRAQEIAGMLASNEHWKTHGHGITRDVAWNMLKIKIEHIERQEGLQRALRGLWAISYLIFERSPAAKFFLSDDYALIFNNLPEQEDGNEAS